MKHNYSFEAILDASSRATWQIDDVLPQGAQIDFGMNLMPESLARTGALAMLVPAERRTLNQIRGHEYLSLFGLVEEFILPFVLDHARPLLDGDDYRIRALLQFAGEEAKHIQLFRMFHDRFIAGFGTACGVIGPASAIGSEVLRHDPLAVALLVLHIEWMTQTHYVDCVRDDRAIDPLFASLLRHHWMEEAQHARIDTLMVEMLADGRDAAGLASAIDDYVGIIHFFDAGFRAQAELNIDALARATGCRLDEPERLALIAQQHQAIRWTYLGSGMTHPRFVETLTALSPEAAGRIAALAASFN